MSLGIAAVAAQGTLLQVGNGSSPETFTTVANVSNISWTPTATMVDTTAHTQGASNATTVWGSQIPTLLKIGDITVDIFWVPEDPTQNSSARGLRGLMENRTLADFQISYPDGNTSTDAFKGYIKSMSAVSKVGGVLTSAVMIAGTGQPSLV